MMKLADTRRQQGQWEQEHDLSERRTSAYEKQFEPQPVLKPWEQEGFSSQEEQVGHAAKMYPERFDMGVKPYAPITPEEWADIERRERLDASLRPPQTPKEDPAIGGSISLAQDVVNKLTSSIDLSRRMQEPTGKLRKQLERARKILGKARTRRLTPVDLAELDSLNAEIADAPTDWRDVLQKFIGGFGGKKTQGQEAAQPATDGALVAGKTRRIVTEGPHAGEEMLYIGNGKWVPVKR